MKSLRKVCICALIVFFTGACSSSKVQDNAIDMLEMGFKKATEIKSLDYTIDLSVESENTIAKFYGTIQGKEGFQASLIMDIAASGVKADRFLEFYLKDDMMYTSMLGQKQKQASPLSQIPNISLDPETITFDKEKVKELFSEASVSGETVHLVFNKKLLEDNKAKLDSATSSLATLDSIKNFLVDIDFEDDFIKKATITLDGVVEGKEQNITMVLSLENINKVQDVAFPNDLDSYVETQDSMLSDIEGL